MPSSLLFLPTVGGPQSSPDARTKTLIRKHVMRDIGLSRRRRNRSLKDSSKAVAFSAGEPHSGSSDISSLAFLKSSDESTLNRNVALTKHAARLPACYTRILKHEAEPLLEMLTYYAPLCNMHPLYTSAWLPLSSLSSAALYQIWSLFASCIKAHHPPTAANKVFAMKSLQIHGRAIREINARLDDSSSRYSDGTAAAISASVQQAFVHGDFALYTTHLRALSIIVQHRGGLSDMEPNTQSMISWSDIMGACCLDCAPEFPLPRWMPDLEHLFAGQEPSVVFQSISAAWRTRLPPQSSLVEVFDNMAILISSGKEIRTQKIWRDEVLLHCTILSLLHRMQSDQSFAIRNNVHNDVAQIVKLVKLGFMLSMADRARKVGLIPESMNVFFPELRRLLEHDKIDWTGLNPIRHWVLCAAAMEEINSGGTWFSQKISTIAEGFPIAKRKRMLDDMRAISSELSEFSCNSIRGEVTESADYVNRALSLSLRGNEVDGMFQAA